MTGCKIHYGVDADVLAWIASGGKQPAVDLPALLRWHARRVAAVERLSQIVVDSLR